MSRYNQLSVGNNVLVEVTDQSVYFEYDTNIDQPFALALTYSEFETLYNTTTTGTHHLTEELTIDITETYIHIISDVLTVSFPRNHLEHITDFYTTIKHELQDPKRKAILVFNDGQNIETRFASNDADETTVENLQSKYTNSETIEIKPATEFQHK